MRFAAFSSLNWKLPTAIFETLQHQHLNFGLDFKTLSFLNRTGNKYPNTQAESETRPIGGFG